MIQYATSDRDFALACLIWVAIIAIVVWSWEWITDTGIPALIRLLRWFSGDWRP